MTVETIEDIVKVTGYEEYLKLIQRIGNLISETLNTVRYPIHVIGFGFDRNMINQLKVYYMLRMFDEEALKQEVIMGKINRLLSQKAINKVLKELGYSEQSTKIEDIFCMMASENFELEFIGLNIEEDKSPSLKLYFKPKLKITTKRKKKPN